MANRTPPPPREFQWTRMLRTLSFWAFLIVGTVVLVQLAARNRQDTEEISYSDFTSQMEQGNVKSVEITERQRVKGDLRTAAQFGHRPVERFTTLLPFESSDAWVSTLRNKGVEVRAKDLRPSFGVIFVNLLPYLLMLGLILFMVRQMQQGGNRAFAFGKSKAKLLSGDTPKVTFADVAGCDEAKQELEEIIDFLKDPQKFQRLGGRLPKGALLVGPPGTGKTLLAKAVAGEAGRPFFSMSGSDFVEMFVGVGASRVRDLFEQGKTHAPCIIFIDEIDAVGRHRGAGLGGGHDEREQTLNQLLVEMDGFESNEGVILVAATNRPDILDPALLRPGRFDRQIVVDMPDVKGREQILRVHTRKIPLAQNVDLERIARATPGLSGAELSNIVNESALLAARRNKAVVEGQDLEDAKDKVMLGLERRSRVLSDEERRPRTGELECRRGRSAEQSHDHPARARAGRDVVPAGGTAAQVHQGVDPEPARHGVRWPRGGAAGIRAGEGDDRRGSGHPGGHQLRAPHGDAVRHERSHRSDRRRRARSRDLPRARGGATAGNLRAHGRDGG